MFFEGSEKKVEIVVAPGAPSLRSLGRDYWAELVSRCSASILSEVSNEQLDAYLLSESSLFVWDDRMLMITCGVITLVDSVTYFLDSYGREHVAMCSFQRKNEYQSHLQKSSFKQDVERLNRLLPGTAYQLGNLDGHHNYVWHMDKPYRPAADDITTELLMYHIQGDAAKYLRSETQSLAGIRELLDLHNLLPGFEIDDFLFEPYGYSMNGIRGDQYITMHITPQENTSYVSFETDLDIPRECPQLLTRLVQILSPASYDVICFNTQPAVSHAPQTHCVARHSQPLACGYQVDFEHFIRSAAIAKRAMCLAI